VNILITEQKGKEKVMPDIKMVREDGEYWATHAINNTMHKERKKKQQE
jgi:hypothetical protein